MNRNEFMGELENLLSDISDNEREEALNYYNDYFNDAGVENEQEVIDSLGTPQKVATIIKDGLNDSEGKKGEFTEQGFSGYEEKSTDEIAKRQLSSEERGFKKRKEMSSGTIVLIVIACIFLIPVLGPLAIGVLTTAFSIMCAIVGVLVSVLLAGVALCIGGLVTLVTAFITLTFSPLVGLMLIGISLLLMGGGILLTILGIFILTKAVPPVVRGFVNLCKMPFKKKGGQ